MRLLCWADQFHPYIGGIEVLTAAALPRLQGLGFDCAVITSRGPLALPDEDHYGAIPIYRFPFRETLESKNPAAIQRLVQRIARLEKSLAPDLVHVFLSDPSCLFHLLARGTHPARMVVSVHNWAALESGPSLFGRVLAEAAWTVGNSRFTLDEMRRVVPACSERSSVIYSAVEGPAAPPHEADFEPLRIVCVGRLVESKGFDVALAAFARLLPGHPGARLQLIGDGPARTALAARAGQLGIAAAVELTGWTDPNRIYEHLDRATVVVVPSRAPETLGQVAIQASLMARPVVASRIGGLPEAVEHERTGLLVEPGDATAIAAAVDRLARSPAYARALGNAARRKALSAFTMPAYVDSVAALYRRIVGN